MTEAKLKRMIVAITVGAVMLLVCLLSVMVYQLFAISKQKRDLDLINQKIAEYKMLIEDGEDTIEVRSSYQWIVREARELGYIFDGDKLYPGE